MVHVRLSAGELAIGSIKVDSWSAFFFSSFIRFNRWREVSSFCWNNNEKRVSNMRVACEFHSPIYSLQGDLFCIRSCLGKWCVRHNRPSKWSSRVACSIPNVVLLFFFSFSLDPTRKNVSWPLQKKLAAKQYSRESGGYSSKFSRQHGVDINQWQCRICPKGARAG